MYLPASSEVSARLRCVSAVSPLVSVDLAVVTYVTIELVVVRDNESALLTGAPPAPNCGKRRPTTDRYLCRAEARDHKRCGDIFLYIFFLVG